MTELRAGLGGSVVGVQLAPARFGASSSFLTKLEKRETS
jgi:hypothetical protein